MSLQILVRKQWSEKALRQSREDPGRKSGSVAGSYIADLCALGKSVILCDFCSPSFNPRRAGYEQWRRDLLVRGRCDDCKEQFPGGHGRMFVPEALHVAVNDEWGRGRRGRRALA